MALITYIIIFADWTSFNTMNHKGRKKTVINLKVTFLIFIHVTLIYVVSIVFYLKHLNSLYYSNFNKKRSNGRFSYNVFVFVIV